VLAHRWNHGLLATFQARSLRRRLGARLPNKSPEWRTGVWRNDEQLISHLITISFIRALPLGCSPRPVADLLARPRPSSLLAPRQLQRAPCTAPAAADEANITRERAGTAGTSISAPSAASYPEVPASDHIHFLFTLRATSFAAKPALTDIIGYSHTRFN
jgi:hypothetical protein